MTDSGTIHLNNNANSVESPLSHSTQPMEEEEIGEEDTIELNIKGIKHIQLIDEDHNCMYSPWKHSLIVK